ncbi:MAG: thymidine kinase, partial [Propionicimonas sp.]|nr:thymidine kinase [Propionicimonas sp.]
MAELVYFTGPMDCGKSTLALQIAYTETEAGRSGRLFTEGDRTGLAMITSRIGLARAAVLVEESLDFWEYVVAELSAG